MLPFVWKSIYKIDVTRYFVEMIKSLILEIFPIESFNL